MAQKRLSPIETGVLSLSLLFLTVSLWEIVQITQPPRRDFFLISYTLMLISLIILTFAETPTFYTLASLVHAACTFGVIIYLNNRFQELEIVLVLAVLINFILRITPRISLFLIFLVVLIQLASYYFAIRYNMTIRFVGYHGRGIAYSLLIEMAFALLFQTLFYYREKLVSSDSSLSETQDALRNLEAASNSFVIHLTELREESAEKERNRITRELHDSLGYAMTNIIMMMNATTYLHDEDRGKLDEYCRMTKDLASTTMDETRNTLYRLRRIGRGSRLNALENLNRLCGDFQASTGVKTELEPGNLPTRLEDHIYQVIFRAIQVGFINALKHSNAGHIRVSFWLSQEELTMIIWNKAMKDRTSCNFPIENEGIGLSGIRERLSVLDGHLEKRPGKFFYELIITIPAESLKGNNHE